MKNKLVAESEIQFLLGMLMVLGAVILFTGG